MPNPILVTKLFIPPSQKNLVKRPRLLEKLDESLQPGIRLTLVCAPAGFGKTTLVSSWAEALRSANEQASPAFAWLSLSEADNDLVTFWSYVLTALQAYDKGLGKRAASILLATQPPDPQAVPAVLINDLAQNPQDLILILDDFHFIRTPAIHQSVAFLIDNAPPRFHVMVLSRTDPPMPLALLRGRGQLLEIRLADLRFSDGEAATYLNERMRLALAEEDVAVLNAKTEGWAAGIQMAGISLQGRQDASQFVQTFSGSNRFILDYLADEILDCQPVEVQTFLLHSSVLEQMSAALCEAVVVGVGNARAVLELLDKANLFLVPLDQERNWYRYHHLFAEILRLKLNQSSPEMIPVLQERAARWFEMNGMLDEAVFYLQAAKEEQALARLIEQNALALIIQGNSASLRKWIRFLPEAIVEKRPWLCILLTWSYISQAEQAQSEPWLERAERLIGQEKANEENAELLGILYSLRTEILHSRGDIAGTIEMGKHALTLLNRSNLTNRGFVYYSLGRAYYASGDLEHALAVWSEFIDQYQNAGIYNMYAPLMSMSCHILTIQGKLQAAIVRAQQAIEFMLSKDIERFVAAGNPYNGLGMAAYQQNELEEADRLITKGYEQNRHSGNLNAISVCLSYRAQVYIAKDELENARADLLEVERIERLYSPYFDARSIFLACRVRFQLARGDLPAAVSQVQKSGLRSDAPLCFEHEQDHISLARVLIAQGNFAEADSLLARLAEAARAGGRFGRLIEILNLAAVARQGQGRTAEGLQMLDASLALAEAQGYIRIFVDEGLPMAQLLKLAVQKAIHPEYARRLLAAYKGIATSPPATTTKIQADNPAQRAALTEREVKVLGLIAAGLTNKEIAQKLYISVRTVKYHTGSIYAKLNANGRAHAAVKAREMGLLK